MIALREHANVRNEVVRELRQLGEQVNASLQDVKSGVQVAQKTLKTEKAVLLAVRSEALVQPLNPLPLHKPCCQPHSASKS